MRLFSRIKSMPASSTFCPLMCQPLNLFFNALRPVRPIPNSASVAGSGTGAADAVAVPTWAELLVAVEEVLLEDTLLLEDTFDDVPLLDVLPDPFELADEILVPLSELEEDDSELWPLQALPARPIIMMLIMNNLKTFFIFSPFVLIFVREE